MHIALFLSIALAGVVLIFNSTEWGIDDAYRSHTQYTEKNLPLTSIQSYLVPSHILDYKIVGALLMVIGGAGTTITIRKKTM